MARARGLRDAVQVAARRLGEHPLIGRAHVDLLPAPYRFWSLTRFQVVLIYDAASEPPRILRLLNTARDLAPLLKGIAGTAAMVGREDDRYLAVALAGPARRRSG